MSWQETESVWRNISSLEGLISTSGSIFEVKKRRRVEPILTVDLFVLVVELAFVSESYLQTQFGLQ